MKFFLNFIFEIEKIDYLTHDTLSAALYFSYIIFLTHDTLFAVFPFFVFEA